MDEKRETTGLALLCDTGVGAGKSDRASTVHSAESLNNAVGRQPGVVDVMGIRSSYRGGNASDAHRPTTWLPAMAASMQPFDGDVHLRIWLGDVAFDYIAAAGAAANFIHDWGRTRWCSIEVVTDSMDERRSLPRLPCERLFQGP